LTSKTAYKRNDDITGTGAAMGGGLGLSVGSQWHHLKVVRKNMIMEQLLGLATDFANEVGKSFKHMNAEAIIQVFVKVLALKLPSSFHLLLIFLPFRSIS
jgi:hypothetical protein